MRSLPTDPTELRAAYAYPDRPWLRANMISSLDGAAWYETRTEALGSPADQRLFALLRELADVVIVGAETVRVEGYGPVKPGPDGVPTPLAIVSRRLDLDFDAPIFTAGPAIVLTAETAPADRLRAAAERAEVIVAGRDGVDFGVVRAELAARGHTRLLCEGGPSVLGRAVLDGALDELCLTLSPALVGGDPSRILTGPPLPAPDRMRLSQAMVDDDFLFLRYVRGR
ncbi:pyrimidine reductase family protein [Actinomadura craniellae]|uniref:Pyrimidine reductase family protein n=1 Tax=Actinomadura craniellae TaxID=2231787 RepID=A0A365GXW7_9ACTN|nr:pyrimidine reductase family protein [Actinomadura craniellae]RAY11670.1 pyrimidine reductase family protein [Actinomadura craniellae]